MVAKIDDAEKQIARNVRIHDRLTRKYEARHGEIFNDTEQNRLREALRRARDLVVTEGSPLRALDFGCGSGNLTRHLLDLGFEVTAADISPGFLQLVESRNRGANLTLLLMNGVDLSGVSEESFDLIAVYSVLHHIPDYLGSLRELARVCKRGGIILLDHEPTERFWTGDSVYSAFRAATHRVDWKKYLSLSNYVHKLRRMIDPRHTNEGDIHVFADDHIEWQRIRELLKDFEILVDEDYLLYRSYYDAKVYHNYKEHCSDMKLMLLRKL